MNKHQSNNKMVKSLIKSKISFNELYLNTLSTKEIKNYVDKYKEEGKKVIIITTYHSLDKLNGVDIDTLYCDEAHTLATEKEGNFKSNFESIKTKNVYFFTATPKDCSDVDDTESFLMNNEDIFGERIGMTMKDAIQKGYITNPMIHIAIPEKYGREDMNNLTNKVKFITDSYNVHSNKVKENSSNPKSIEAKMLVKCESVDEMWALYERLVGKLNAGMMIPFFVV
jgi:superfamily II DNA or RNA helicase